MKGKGAKASGLEKVSHEKEARQFPVLPPFCVAQRKPLLSSINGCKTVLSAYVMWDFYLRGGSIGDPINVLLQFKQFPHTRSINLHLEEVYIIPFPLEYYLSTFVIYKGHTEPLLHRRRFKCQCDMLVKTDALHPKIVPIIFKRNRL